MRRAVIQHQTKRMKIQNIDGTEFVDLQLVDGDNAVGKSVTDLAKLLPEGSILVTVRRKGKVIIPHGNTIFQAGDQITAFVQTKSVELLYKCFRDGNPEQLIEE